MGNHKKVEYKCKSKKIADAQAGRAKARKADHEAERFLIPEGSKRQARLTIADNLEAESAGSPGEVLVQPDGRYRIEDLKEVLHVKGKAVDHESLCVLSDSLADPEFQGQTLLDYAITYKNVLRGNTVSMAQYLNAIRFVSYLDSVNHRHREAYIRVFSDRAYVQDRIDAKYGSKEWNELGAAARRYSKSKAVVGILEISGVIFKHVFAGQRIQAVMVLADVMVNADMDRDKINAAKELLAATEGPAELNVNIQTEVKESSALDQMNAKLNQIADTQLSQLKSNTGDLATFGALTVSDKSDTLEGELM